MVDKKRQSSVTIIAFGTILYILI